MSTVNMEISRRFTELFSSSYEALADSVLSSDVVFHGTAGDGELRGVDAMKRFVGAYRGAFPDARSTVEDQVAEGDKVVTRWRACGTHKGQLGPIAATGREIRDGRDHDRAHRGRQDRGGVGGT
jgi:predicted ester cyclase